MDRQIFVDRLLENENLTGDLTDAAARVLIDWGVAQVDSLLGMLTAEEEMESRFTAITRFMRGINRLVGSLPDVDPEGLQAILLNYAAIFGDGRRAENAECEIVAGNIAQMDAAQAVNFLLGWVLPAAPSANPQN